MAEPRYIVDAGPIVAALNRRDGDHVWAKAVFATLGEPPVTCEAVVTEVCWHLRDSPDAVARVLEMPSRGDLQLFPVAETEGVALAGLVRNTASGWISLTPESFVWPKFSRSRQKGSCVNN